MFEGWFIQPAFSEKFFESHPFFLKIVSSHQNRLIGLRWLGNATGNFYFKNYLVHRLVQKMAEPANFSHSTVEAKGEWDDVLLDKRALRQFIFSYESANMTLRVVEQSDPFVAQAQVCIRKISLRKIP